MTIQVESFGRAHDLLERAEGYLRQRALENNLALAICEGLAREPEPAAPLLLALRDEHGCRGVALMRAGHPLVVTDMPRPALTALAAYLREQAIEVCEFQAPEPCGEWLVDALEQSSRRRYERGRTLIVYALSSLSDLIEPANPGRPRDAEPNDGPTIARWVGAFCSETDFRIGDPDEFARARIAAGRAFIYDLDGAPVSLSCIGGQARGISRIGPVYTPPELRGRGYARALVGYVTRAILERAEEACLFAEAANPASNQVYVGLGYREVSRVTMFQQKGP